MHEIKWNAWVGIRDMISQDTACFSNDRTWSEEGDQWSQCPSVIYVIHKLCVLCSMRPGSHKVDSQAAGDGGSHEQNVNTEYGINYKRM